MTDILNIKIQIDGKAVSDSYNILSIQTHSNLSGVSQARIAIQAEELNHRIIDIEANNDWKLGALLEVKAGYGTDDATIFSGTIESRTLSVDDEVQAFEIICQNSEYEPSHHNTGLHLTYGTDILSIRITNDDTQQNFGVIRIQGTPNLEPGMDVTLEGLGKAYDGIIEASTVNHDIANGVWYSELDLGQHQ